MSPIATSAGPGGSGGGVAPCVILDDCPLGPNACVMRTCTAGVCGLEPVPANTPLGTQATGDCHRDVCDGSGEVQRVVEDEDVPNDHNECTTDSCDGGNVVHDASEPGTTCATGVCNDMAMCVECNVGGDCPGMDDECQQRTCDAEACGLVFTAAQTALAIQVTGDCHELVCDGQGANSSVVDDTDLPVDFNDCTADLCENGNKSNPPLNAGTPCGTSGLCDGNGSCVGCITPNDCPGTDDFCKQRTCTNNVCGFNFTPNTTPLPQQNAGDCQLLQCNGAGAVQSVADNSDPLNDNNQCTDDLCNGGMPSNPAVAPGTMCNQNGGSVCSVNGQCVQCNVAANCPQPSQPCKVASCVNNNCGTANASAGTVCTAPSCASGTQQNADTCDQNGACLDGGTTLCAPYVCGPTTCTSSCLTDSGCSSGNTCDVALGICTNGPKCTDYCNIIQANCAGSNQQYTSPPSCVAVCAEIPKGMVGEGSGNTLGCRISHATLAASDPITHCTHGGPGGDGACGSNCTGFCTVALEVCTGANQQYASMSACMTECATFPTTPKYSTGVVSGNSFACRLYHLTQAAVDPSVHCGHIVANSPTCS